MDVKSKKKEKKRKHISCIMPFCMSIFQKTSLTDSMNFSMIAFTVTPNKISEASLLPVSICFIFKFPQLFQRRLLVLVVTMLESLPRPVLCCYGCGSNPTISSSPSPLTSFHPSGRARGQRDIQFSSVQSLGRVGLCNPMNCRTPGLPVHHHAVFPL